MRVASNPDVADRARQLEGLGFGSLDALHLAFAEHAEAEWFVTTDDRLLKRAWSLRDRFRFEVMRPDDFLLETAGGTS
ncbi:MAG: hypothetical protein ACRD3J_15505 [Thermoanaerobaculia bacterium]